MSATEQRDQTSEIAKQNPSKALEKARGIRDPWFKAQALSWVARFTDGDSVAIAREAANAASDCDDQYKRTAVRAWEIAAYRRAWSLCRSPEGFEVGDETIEISYSIILSLRGANPTPARSV